MVQASITVEAKPRAIIVQLDPETGAVMEVSIVADVTGPTGNHQAQFTPQNATLKAAAGTFAEAAPPALEAFLSDPEHPVG